MQAEYNASRNIRFVWNLLRMLYSESLPRSEDMVNLNNPPLSPKITHYKCL